MAQWVKNPSAAAFVAVEVWVETPTSAEGWRIRIAAAVAQITAVVRIQFLAQELPYAEGAPTKWKKKPKNKKPFLIQFIVLILKFSNTILGRLYGGPRNYSIWASIQGLRTAWIHTQGHIM